MVEYAGPWVAHGNGNASRVVTDVTITDINVDLAAVHVASWYESRYAVVDSSAMISVTGTPSGSAAFTVSHGSGGGRTQLTTFSANVQKQYGNAVSGSYTVTLSGIGAVGGTLAVSGSWSVPAKAYAPPRVIPWASVTRVSDSTQRLQWGHDMDPASGPQPIHAFNIYRSTNGGATQLVASLPATVSTWDDTTTAPNSAYTYTLYAFNSAGASPGRIAGLISTTPAPPTIGAATKTGGAITLAYTDHSTVETGHDIEHDFGAGTEVLVGPGGSGTTGARTWTHSSPNAAQTHRYRVRAKNASGASAWSAWSNTVQLQAPPLAPTVTAPTGPQDVAQPVTVRWVHNPVDTSPQRSYRLAYRAQGTTTWTYTPVTTSAVSQHTFPAGTLTVGAWEILAQTSGDHATPSPYSATHLVTVSSRPLMTITEPGGSVGSNQALTHFSFHDPDGGEQTAWRARLTRGGDVLHEREATGTDTTYSTPAILENGATYTITVWGRDEAGLWSAPATVTFTATYEPPPAATVLPEWRENEGAVVLTVETDLPGDGVPAVASVRVQRADGPGWATLYEGSPSGAVVDRIPPLGQAVTYRAVTLSAIGAATYGEPVTIETSCMEGWIWLNGGPGWATSAHVRSNPSLGWSAGPPRELVQFDGRAAPVEFQGETYAHSGTLAVDLFPDDATTPGDILAVTDLPAPICLREPRGPRRFVSLGAPAFTQTPTPVVPVSIPWTVVDHREGE